MASPRSSNGGGAARWSGLIALPDFGSRVLSASAVVAYVALGAAAILSGPSWKWHATPSGGSYRVTASTSPLRVSRLFCMDITSYPSAASVGITLLKHEPSAQIPWANTMLAWSAWAWSPPLWRATTEW